MTNYADQPHGGIGWFSLPDGSVAERPRKAKRLGLVPATHSARHPAGFRVEPHGTARNRMEPHGTARNRVTAGAGNMSG